MLGLLRKVTVEQWRAIDEEYLDRPLPDVRVAWILVIIAVCLVLPRYFGSPKFITSFAAVRGWFDTLPYPDLWPRVYWSVFKLANYCLIPVLFIRLVLRAPVRDFGLRIRRERAIWLLYAGMLIVVLPLTYAASFTDAFLQVYPKYDGAGQSLGQFLIWSVAYGLQFVMLEFFFRGFSLFALARHLGSSAIFVMIVPYAMLHLSKPLPEALGSIVTGIVLGTIALRTRSIYGGVFVHCGVAWSMDIFALSRLDALPW